MIMPYSTKPTGAPAGSGGPDKVRHAAQKQCCIMTAATWSKPLFDIDQMRQSRYPLPDESISDDTASEISRIVQACNITDPKDSASVG
jgi:hypothetical protein